MNGLSVTGTSGITDRQTFGAAVVSKTLDYMNGASSGPAPFDRQTAGAAVVSKTLDYMNAAGSGMHKTGADYDFQKSVLGAAYTGKGSMVDSYL